MQNTREIQIQTLQTAPLDVLVLGGGINGAGVLRDLALRSALTGAGLRAGLVEKGQFGSGTSGRNSQLIHGGLRYLKNLEVVLVREALRERALLLQLAPGYVRPLQFLMPFYGRFARWFYGAGLTVYDVLAGSRYPGRHSSLTRGEALRREPSIESTGLSGAALFWDGRVDAARLVLANISDALAHGAAAANYLHAGEARRDAGLWRVPVTDTLSGARFEIAARKLIDTTGPWTRSAAVRLVRGSHIVLPRLTAGEHAIAWFEPGGRIVFVIPWGENNDLSLVGTTDVDHDSSPDDVRISAAEMEYLLDVVGRIFPSARGIAPLSAYSALRPLVPENTRSATRTSREHRIWNSPEGILHVSGGKYTTYRLMSEQAADLAAREIAPALAALHLTAETPFATEEPPLDRAARIRFAVERDWARRLADLMFVSTYWGYEQQWTRERLEPLAREMGALLGWGEARVEEEIGSVLWATALPGPK